MMLFNQLSKNQTFVKVTADIIGTNWLVRSNNQNGIQILSENGTRRFITPSHKTWNIQVALTCPQNCTIGSRRQEKHVILNNRLCEICGGK